MNDQRKYLDSLFGESPPPQITFKAPKEVERGIPVAVHPDKAKGIFDRKNIERLADSMKITSEPEEPVFYKNKLGLVDAADVRFVDGDKKQVITFWWNGRTMVAKNPPNVLWGRDLLEQRKNDPVLIVEGAKNAVAACAIPGLVPVSWMRGAESAGKADWSILKDRTVYMYPDDDEPGAIAAKQILMQLPNMIVVQPLEEARKIKEKGADIVEALQVMTADKLAEYITGSGTTIKDTEGPVKGEWKPFKVLGTGDDGRLYCLDRHGRLCGYDPKTLTKTKLLTLADLFFWVEMFPAKSGFDGDDACNWLIGEGDPDFDTDIIRGRGAWSEKNGDICYHDGKCTIGQPSEKRMYVRKVQHSIGLDAPRPSQKTLKRVRDIVTEFTFKTKVEACRLLNWATLAPFGGALPWRPALLVSGESGSGKSTVMDFVLRPLSVAFTATGGGSTEAGIRQAVANDSRAVIIEEAEGDTIAKKQLRDALFSLMRQSTSDDAPQIVKGTAGDQKGLSFTMRSMFCFLSIDPTIEFSADDNRIFRIEMIKADSGREDHFKKLSVELRGLLTPETCAGIRAMTFERLPEIIALGRRIDHIVRDCSGRDMRFGLADGLLWACYWLIWDGRESVTDEFVREFLTRAYGAKPEETRRNDSGEMIDRLLDEMIDITGDQRRKMTIREACIYVRDGVYFDGIDIGPSMIKEIDESLGRNGIKMFDDGNVGFAAKHHAIQKVLQCGIDFARSLARHPGVAEHSRRARINGAQRRCVVIGGLLDEPETGTQTSMEY